MFIFVKKNLWKKSVFSEFLYFFWDTVKTMIPTTIGTKIMTDCFLSILDGNKSSVTISMSPQTKKS